ncbi:YggS family pyridoxal phosphate-dependent enzyme [Desulfonatronum sp. SC1]|uniref:YggS family pyridoxal phosphate-dependent enzyme n=1 Tax=Desulfonatronum sp. SC1 TaxID=2109626 RepID=UPI000D307922|nr:YggS family pyridoxal phosphate-dependent enzyme [Desulfonatronum sp. SC1]PTN32017.1 YggS family pyridoxal phosphate-dependent enzyme [Desulfonatronum sp. SC1]
MSVTTEVDAHDGEGLAADLSERYARTRQLVAELAVRHGRRPEEVRIVAVSKYQPATAVTNLAGAGQRDFGESYVQEALAKQRVIRRPDLRWHFLGRLQRNKAKYLPGNFMLFHGLDNAALALDLHERLQVKSQMLDVLIQVNLGDEPQKGGVTPGGLPALAEHVGGLSGLALRGLMALPPFELDLAHKQRLFGELRRLRDAVQRQTGLWLPELSMGTTDDFPQAIAEGATMVRIGTRIFGDRPERVSP